MPPQHIEVAETIAALKRKLKRDQSAATDEPISSATNRGNKLKKGASNAHAGALPYPHSPNGLKQQADHAGYTRYIVERNPKRYNEYGYELEDSESDTEADADAEDENAYSDVRLEELLRPLTHPSELATHPTLSAPFLDSALPNMVESLQEKLRQERANLWRAKMLHRQLIGDENWMPCGAVLGKDDWGLFEPRPKPAQEGSRKRKRNEAQVPIRNGISRQDNASNARGPAEQMASGKDASNKNTSQGEAPPAATTEQQANPTDGQKDSAVEDVEMQDGEHTTNGIHIKTDPHEAETLTEAPAQINSGDDTIDEGNTGQDPDNPDGPSNAASPTPPTRRITRALAAENTSTAPTPPLSPNPSESTVDSSLLTVDPIFLLPPQMSTAQRLPSILQALQLPVDELLDTRRLLFTYIQKQEESVRGFEAVLGKLIKAKRMKEQVWEWAKAEGHVGEWSDGEDWIDAEAWGEREEELKKGKDEEDVPEDEGRKVRRNRRGARE